MTSEAVSATCVQAGTDWACEVTVGGGPGSTNHQVSVSVAELERFAPGEENPTGFVERSFAFLLAREPKASILRRFAISDIERYFPDYPSAIRNA